MQSVSSKRLTGFKMYSRTPHRIAVLAYSKSRYALITTYWVVIPAASAFSIMASPSNTGMRISVITASGFHTAMVLYPSMPSPHSRTSISP